MKAVLILMTALMLLAVTASAQPAPPPRPAPATIAPPPPPQVQLPGGPAAPLPPSPLASVPPPPPGGGRGDYPSPPFRGPSIRVERDAGGTLRLDAHCGDAASAKACADTTLAIFDRVNTPAM